jgi:hypothetical protein
MWRNLLSDPRIGILLGGVHRRHAITAAAECSGLLSRLGRFLWQQPDGSAAASLRSWNGDDYSSPAALLGDVHRLSIARCRGQARTQQTTSQRARDRTCAAWISIAVACRSVLLSARGYLGRKGVFVYDNGLLFPSASGV